MSQEKLRELAERTGPLKSGVLAVAGVGRREDPQAFRDKGLAHINQHVNGVLDAYRDGLLQQSEARIAELEREVEKLRKDRQEWIEAAWESAIQAVQAEDRVKALEAELASGRS